MVITEEEAMEVKLEEQSIMETLERVKDPEVPVLSVVDLGIVRQVEVLESQSVRVTITPTYTGCPAMETIEKDIKSALEAQGYRTEVVTRLSPAWTTDWLSGIGRKKLEQYGIAPPVESTTDKSFLTGEKKSVRCPRCKSTTTSMISQFGSTACKALYRCDDCLESFEYFKCI